MKQFFPALYSVTKFLLASLVFICIGVMICGVILRYIFVPITDWLDVDAVGFFWVEEVGELTLTWLVMIGAAVGVSEGSHFYLSGITHQLSIKARKALGIINQILIALFGCIVGFICFKLYLLNKELTSPALELSLGIYYLSACVGGILMLIYTIKNLISINNSNTSA